MMSSCYRRRNEFHYVQSPSIASAKVGCVSFRTQPSRVVGTSLLVRQNLAELLGRERTHAMPHAQKQTRWMHRTKHRVFFRITVKQKK